MKTHHIQKRSVSHISCGDPMPIREVQCHENDIQGKVVRAWYVKTEDGKLHGQFHSEADADRFARLHDINR